jgi:putative ABC transport system permease protein
MPHPFDWLLRLGVPKDDRQVVLGDLAEEYHRRVLPERGWVGAQAWYLRELCSALGFALIGRARQCGRAVATFRLESVWEDLRYAIRGLRRSPGFTVVAVVSLTLGIGANTAVFSVIDSLVLRRLPVRDPVSLAQLRPRANLAAWTNPQWEQLRDHGSLFDGMVAWSQESFAMEVAGTKDAVEGLYVSGSYFEVLGIRPQAGRVIAPGDDIRAGGANGPVAVLSDQFWQRRFGGRLDILDTAVSIDNVMFTIVGVAPRGFVGAEVGRDFDIAVPIASERLIRRSQSALDRWNNAWLTVVARLKPGQSISEALRAFRGLRPMVRASTLPPGVPEQTAAKYLQAPFDVQAAANGISSLRSKYQQPLQLTMAVVAMVLLIACGNVANLLLARGAARRYELTLRVALGASRIRIVRQLLTECLLLSVAGALAGLWLAMWVGPLLVRQLATATGARQASLDVSLDWRVLAFTACAAISTALLFGTVPALRAVRFRASEALADGGRAVTRSTRNLLGAGIVIAQVAMSLVLVNGAGLFVRTLVSLAAVDLGFDSDRVVVSTLSAARTTVSLANRSALFDQILDAVSATPGVSEAAYSAVTPVSGSMFTNVIDIPGGSPVAPADRSVHGNFIGPNWFDALGIRRLAGRDFEAFDRVGTTPVVIVNSALARQFFPGDSAIGKAITRSETPDRRVQLEIVGVVQDAIYESLREPVRPTMYLPIAQQSVAPTRLELIVRSRDSAPGAVAPALARAIAAVNRDVVVTSRPLTDDVAASLAPERLVTGLFSFFGALALLVAALGLYGIMAHSVGQRRVEMAIRLALGAAPGTNAWMVIKRALAILAMGIILGGALSLWAGRFIGSLLFGVASRDLVTLLGAALVLTSVGLAATWLPARGAGRLNPTTILREG